MLPGQEFIRGFAARVVSLPGRALPYAIQAPILDLALNSAFRVPLGNGELDFLDGSRVRIRVTDLGLDWLIEVDADRFHAIDRQLPEDVSISGDSLDFLLLAARRADPDTLFFQRRIRIEGDTELGLGVKNTMDSMDWDDLPPPLRRLLRGVNALIARARDWRGGGARDAHA